MNDAQAAVLQGALAMITPTAVDDLKAFVRIGQEDKVEKRFELCTGLTAPVARNTPCGSVTFVSSGRELGKVDLVVPEDVPAIGMRGRLKRMLGF